MISSAIPAPTLSDFSHIAEQAALQNRSEIRRSHDGNFHPASGNRLVRFFRHIGDMFLPRNHRQALTEFINSARYHSEEGRDAIGETMISHNVKAHSRHPLTLSFMRDTFECINNKNCENFQTGGISFKKAASSFFSVTKTDVQEMHAKIYQHKNEDKISEAIKDGAKILSRNNLKVLSEKDLKAFVKLTLCHLCNPDMVDVLKADPVLAPFESELENLFSSIDWSRE